MGAKDRELGELLVHEQVLDGMSEITALSMIREDIQEVKAVLREHQAETKAEFSRVRDKIDSLNVQHATESKDSAVAIRTLENDHKHIAARIGAAAGFIGALVVTAFAAVIRWLAGNGGVGGGT